MAGGSGSGDMLTVGTCVRSVCTSALGVPVLSSAFWTTPATAFPLMNACTCQENSKSAMSAHQTPLEPRHALPPFSITSLLST